MSTRSQTIRIQLDDDTRSGTTHVTYYLRENNVITRALIKRALFFCAQHVTFLHIFICNNLKIDDYKSALLYIEQPRVTFTSTI
jgi:hypothetical protein